jgi:plastocyanin
MRFLLPLALVAVLVAGCGDDDESTTTPSGNPAAESTETGPAGSGSGNETGGSEAPGDTVEVKMTNIQFDPQSITVKVGQTVKWTNEDDVQHDADATEGEFESELYGQGGTQEWKAEEAGTVEYVCSVHPNMTGTITVE